LITRASATIFICIENVQQHQTATRARKRLDRPIVRKPK
jgi:hypothetical protein